MERKMIVNDIRANKLLAVSICFFMTASAFLAALAGMLSAGLLGSVEVLMEKAKTPDFLQMHTGTIEEEEVFRLAGENEAVESCQILKFLNLSNASLTLGGQSMTDSTQDNGVCTQSAAFDFLLDMENEVITVREGEIYVPVCYRQEYGLEAGQTVQIGARTFVIAGFLRDSQMSSMMASSKRFLVCGKDYERLRAQGTEEYLIEFLLREETDVNVFAKEYADAKLPANGPAITRPLIRMMNALSEGLLCGGFFWSGCLPADAFYFAALYPFYSSDKASGRSEGNRDVKGDRNRKKRDQAALFREICAAIRRGSRGGALRRVCRKAAAFGADAGIVRPAGTGDDGILRRSRRQRGSGRLSAAWRRADVKTDRDGVGSQRAYRTLFWQDGGCGRWEHPAVCACHARDRAVLLYDDRAAELKEYDFLPAVRYLHGNRRRGNQAGSSPDRGYFGEDGAGGGTACSGRAGSAVCSLNDAGVSFTPTGRLPDESVCRIRGSYGISGHI